MGLRLDGYVAVQDSEKQGETETAGTTELADRSAMRKIPRATGRDSFADNLRTFMPPEVVPIKQLAAV